MIIFDGLAFAQEREAALKPRVAQLHQPPIVGAIYFQEDKGSQLYTRLKKEAAERLNIQYRDVSFSLADPVEKITQQVQAFNADPTVTGIIIQKLTKYIWAEVSHQNDFHEWWWSLVSAIAQKKDVDGLHPETLAAIEQGVWQQQGKVMPATAKAVLEILKTLGPDGLMGKKISILGRTEILGRPLYYELRNHSHTVELLGSKDLQQRVNEGAALLDSDIIISSTGRPKLITNEMIKDGAVLIDVGEPHGDVDVESVRDKAAFLTPVPGGVGPVTVICLLENAVDLLS